MRYTLAKMIEDRMTLIPTQMTVIIDSQVSELASEIEFKLRKFSSRSAGPHSTCYLITGRDPYIGRWGSATANSQIEAGPSTNSVPVVLVSHDRLLRPSLLRSEIPAAMRSCDMGNKSSQGLNNDSIDTITPSRFGPALSGLVPLRTLQELLKAVTSYWEY